MNSLERYLAMLAGEPVDYIPRTPILMQYAAEFIGSNYGLFASDHRVLTKANVKCAERFGIDQLSAISDPYRETAGFGAEIQFVPEGPPHSTHPLMEKKDFLHLLKPDPLKSERMLDRIRAVQAFKALGEYSILGWVEGPAAEAADLRDVIPFLMDTIEDLPYACDLMDLCVETGIAFAIAQIDAGADTIGIGDAIVSQISPVIYEEVIQPKQKKLVSAIKEKGAFAKLHICGDITHLLPGIADLGVDILDVDHMVDMARVREIVGSKVVITGNIDPTNGVLRGTPEAICQTMLEIYEQVGNPYMVNAGCEIPSATPVENLLALCEPIRYKS